jgi:[protein-PII] uridylyltransferase
VVEHAHHLWDLGLKVGHATRSVDDCIRQAKADMTIRTNLLEARYLCGDHELYQDLRRRYAKEVVAGTGRAFVEAKLAERDERHRRMGVSRYALEPNIKEGKGGLRDLHALFWIAKYLYEADDAATLVERGVFTAAEAATFDKAEAFLWTVRVGLHDLAGRADERLTFDLQPELAERLGYRDHAGTRGVERLMKHYFLTPRTSATSPASSAPSRPRTAVGLPPPDFRIFRQEIEGRIDGGRLAFTDAKRLTDKPVDMLPVQWRSAAASTSTQRRCA